MMAISVRDWDPTRRRRLYNHALVGPQRTNAIPKNTIILAHEVVYGIWHERFSVLLRQQNINCIIYMLITAACPASVVCLHAENRRVGSA